MSIRQQLRMFWCKISLHQWLSWMVSDEGYLIKPYHGDPYPVNIVKRRRCVTCGKRQAKAVTSLAELKALGKTIYDYHLETPGG